ncbi:MAG: PadR family transcriptional regulator [Solirubrobacteraceae bacterium]
MGERAAGDRVGRQHSSPTTSLVHWALLGLVIERPSYAYDLAERFERRYNDVLALSNVGHVYTALSALESRALIEEIAGTRRGRQPRPRYRATVKGLDEYRAWLVSQAGEDRRRHELFVLGLRALAPELERLLEVLARYEQAWMKEGMKTSIAREPDGAGDSVPALFGRLSAEEKRLAIGAELAWVQYAREEIQAFVDGNARRVGDEHHGRDDHEGRE